MNESNPSVPLVLADLSKMDHEPLIVLAVELEFRPARAALLFKCEAAKNAHVRRLAQHRGWRAADIHDAQREAVGWVNEAVDSYDISQVGLPGGRRFCSHLFQVIDRRFADYIRSFNRRDRRVDRRVEVTDDFPVEHGHHHCGTGYSLGDDGGLTDPAAIAEYHEEMQLLQRAVCERDKIDQRIFALHVFERMSEPEVGVQLNLTDAAVKHRWRNMLKELKARFRDPEMPTPVMKSRGATSSRSKTGRKHES